MNLRQRIFPSLGICISLACCFITSDAAAGTVVEEALKDAFKYLNEALPRISEQSNWQPSENLIERQRLRTTISNWPQLLSEEPSRTEWELVRPFLESRREADGGAYAAWVRSLYGTWAGTADKIANATHPLYHAAAAPYPALLRAILKFDPTAKPSLDGYGGAHNTTALFAACVIGHLEVAELLLDAGADPSLAYDPSTGNGQRRPSLAAADAARTPEEELEANTVPSALYLAQLRAELYRLIPKYVPEGWRRWASLAYYMREEIRERGREDEVEGKPPGYDDAGQLNCASSRMYWLSQIKSSTKEFHGDERGPDISIDDILAFRENYRLKLTHCMARAREIDHAQELFAQPSCLPSSASTA